VNTSNEDDCLPLLLLRYLLETFCMNDVKPPANQSQQYVISVSLSPSSSVQT